MKVLGKRELDIGRIVTSSAVITTADWNESDIIWRIPVVRVIVGDKYKEAELVVGRHELDRRARAGKVTVPCKQIACSDGELSFLRRADILSPKPLVSRDNEAMLEVLNLLVERIGHYADELKGVTGGRPTTPKGALQALLSTQRGVGVRALRMADKRKRDREAAPELTLPDRIETFGLELDEEFLGELDKIQSTLYNAEAFVTQAIRKLRTLKSLDFPGPTMNALVEQAKLLSKAIHEARPGCLCGRCKGIDGLQEKCGMCLTTGWSSRAQMAREDKRLFDTDEPVVSVDGRLEPLAKFLAEPEPEQSDPFDDPSYDAFIAASVKDCRCCDACSQVPCAGVMAGGLCDQACHCAREEEIEAEPQDDDGDPDYVIEHDVLVGWRL